MPSKSARYRELLSLSPSAVKCSCVTKENGKALRLAYNRVCGFDFIYTVWRIHVYGSTAVRSDAKCSNRWEIKGIMREKYADACL